MINPNVGRSWKHHSLPVVALLHQDSTGVYGDKMHKLLL